MMIEKSHAEFMAFNSVYEALCSLDKDAQKRVLNSVSMLLGLGDMAHMKPIKSDSSVEKVIESEASDNVSASEKIYETFSELYAAFSPNSNADRALIAGYWLQIIKGQENFAAQAVNSELTHLGHRIGHITSAIDSLKNTKPHLALQLRKSGSSPQARKTYKLSDAGIRRVQETIDKQYGY